MNHDRFYALLLLLGLVLTLASMQRPPDATALSMSREALPQARSGVRPFRPTLTPLPPEGPLRPTLTPLPDMRSDPAASASICLRLTTDPSSAITPDMLASYHLSAWNTGRGRANGVELTLPFAGGVQDVVDARLSSPSAWVSALRSNEVDLHLESLDPDEIVTATVRLHTSAAVAPGTFLATRARLQWTDAVGGGAGLSNQISLIVADASANRLTVPLDIVPSTGSPQTTFTVTYGSFTANEGVSRWYHRPNGQIVALDEIQANEQGQIVFSLAAAPLSTGTYSVVVYGQCSRVTATGTFSVSTAASNKARN